MPSARVNMADASTSHLPHTLSDDDADADGDNDHESGLPPDLDVAVPQEGTAYHDFESLRHAVNAWSLRDGFIARCSKKDTSRAQYRCRYFKDGCPWAVRASIHRNTGLLTVTSVNPKHNCSPPEVWLNHEGLEQRGKRAVHATQRWVVDTLNRIGYKPQVTTDPKDIVKVIQERCGTTITDRLAHKSRDRLLLSLGVQPPLPHGRGGRPDQVAMRKRMREEEAELAQRHQQQAESRAREMDNGFDFDAPGEDALDDRPFTFESGFRIIEQPRALASPERGPVPAGLPGTTMLHELQQAAMNTNVAVPAMRSGEMETCQHCKGTGLVPRGQQPKRPRLTPTAPSRSMTQSNVNTSSTAGGTSTAGRTSSSVNSNAMADANKDDDELSLLQQQVALIAKQIEVMTRRRQGGV